MTRYLTLYSRFIRNSLSGQLIFRANFVANLFIYIGWVALQIIFIEAVFDHTKSLAGWSREQVYLLLAFGHLGERMFNLFFRDNLMTLPDLITDGGLDGVLTKPVATLFWVSVRHLHILGLVNLYFPAALFFYVFREVDLHTTGGGFVAATVLALCGIAVSYAALLALETMSFWFLRFSNVHELHAAVLRMSRYPLDIYGRARGIFFTIIPVAFTSYLPALAVLGQLSWIWVVYGIVFAAAAVWAAISFWNFAIRRYSSASS